MKIRYKGSLQRTMIIYFLLISFASSLIVAEFIVDIQRPELRYELAQNFEKLSQHEIVPEEAFRPIERIRNKAVLMVVLLLVVVAILLTMFIKSITGPLQSMIEISKKISGGDLSQTVRIQRNNELAEMGNTLNELTSNLQEMILLSRDMCASADRFVQKVSGVLASGQVDPERAQELQREMRQLDSKIRLLNGIIANCKFYGL